MPICNCSPPWSAQSLDLNTYFRSGSQDHGKARLTSSLQMVLRTQLELCFSSLLLSQLPPYHKCLSWRIQPRFQSQGSRSSEQANSHKESWPFIEKLEFQVGTPSLKLEFSLFSGAKEMFCGSNEEKWERIRGTRKLPYFLCVEDSTHRQTQLCYKALSAWFLL